MMAEEAAFDERKWARWWRLQGAEELSQILFWRWDPIGVADDLPYTRGEYDSYTEPIVLKLKAGATSREIGDYLAEIEMLQMEVRSARKRRGRAAELLVQWYAASMDWWAEFGPYQGQGDE